MAGMLPKPPAFNVTPSSLTQSAAELLKIVRKSQLDLINTIAPQDATFQNAIQPLANIENKIKGNVEYIALFQAVSTSLEIRQASSAAIKDIDDFYLSIFQDRKLFELVSAVYQRQIEISEDDMSNEDHRLLEKLHNTFMENGHGIELQENDLARFKWISSRLIELRVKFMENLGSTPGYLWKNEGELSGLDEHVLKILPMHERNGLRGIKLTKSMITEVLSKCHDSETRESVFIEGQKMNPENSELLKETVILRDEKARLLGFPSFVSQQAMRKMIQSPTRIHQILDDLSIRLSPKAKTEIEILSEMKDNRKSPFYLWDFDYYHHKLLRTKYDVDHNLVSEYFPAELTIERMLQIFETVFSLRIEESNISSSDQVWHPDVRMFSVSDASSQSFFGYLYVDIYPRDGKFSHAANFNIFPNYSPEVGEKDPIVCTALVCNVSRNQGGKPSLLKHSEVVTIFHELGHGIHDLVGRSKYAAFHGHRTVADFTEAPSQLLEYWCWDPESLQKLSYHYSYIDEENAIPSSITNSDRVPKEMPLGLAESIAATKIVNQGILTLRQIAFSKFDLEIHGPSSHESLESIDLREIYNTLLQNMTFLHGPEDDNRWGNGYAATSHYMWGQEANYYSYIYTRILAADIWHSAFRSDPMSQEAGLRYRKMILEKGGRDGEERTLHGFLGREPKIDAYLSDLQID